MHIDRDIVFNALHQMEWDAEMIDNECSGRDSIQLLEDNAMPMAYIILRSWYENDEDEKWMNKPMSLTLQ